MFSKFTPAATDPGGTQSPESVDTPVVATTSDTAELPSAEGMIAIPAGTYEVGINPADDYHSASTNVTLSAFWVDKYQTTNSQYEEYIAATGSNPPGTWPGKDNHPVRGVTWDQAAAYCSWANKRLPIEAEWEAAGRGAGVSPSLYPWGNDPSDGGKTFTLPDQDTYEVGTVPFNVSSSGVFDMVGNVWEWVGEPYNVVQDGYKILRGGRFSNPQDLAYRLTVLPNDKLSEYAGFRCAASQVR